MENAKMKIKREIGTVGVGAGLNAEERLSLVHLLIKAGICVQNFTPESI